MKAPARQAAVVGDGLVTTAITAALKLEGFPVRRSARVWVVVGKPDMVEPMLVEHPDRAVVVVADADTPVMCRCRWLELGAAYVIVPPIFPREVVAVVRAVWRGLAREA